MRTILWWILRKLQWRIFFKLGKNSRMVKRASHSFSLRLFLFTLILTSSTNGSSTHVLMLKQLTFSIKLSFRSYKHWRLTNILPSLFTLKMVNSNNNIVFLMYIELNGDHWVRFSLIWSKTDSKLTSLILIVSMLKLSLKLNSKSSILLIG